MSELEFKEIEKECATNKCLKGVILEGFNLGQPNDLSARITMLDGKTREFFHRQDFWNWLARQQPIPER